jgi:mRNA-degrading endonuclease RelE of RelBE toxin-antitoxin system
LHAKLAGWRSSDIGNLRILYAVVDEVRVLDVIDIGPRGDVYKR